MDQARIRNALQTSSLEIANACPDLAAALSETILDASPARGPARLLACVLRPTWMPESRLARIAETKSTQAPDDRAAALDDLVAISRRNLEIGDTGCGMDLARQPRPAHPRRVATCPFQRHRLPARRTIHERRPRPDRSHHPR